MTMARKTPSGALFDLRKRAAADDVDALNALVEAYRDGLNTDDGAVLIRPNRAMANRYEQRAAALGDPASMTAIADRVADKSFRGRSRSVAVGLYTRAFESGYPTAAMNLAARYQREGLVRDAVAWYRRALAAGDPTAMVPVARAELYGIGTARNAKRAFARLREAARAKDVYFPEFWFQCQAMIVMAEALISGWVVKRDIKAGLRWLRTASSHGSSLAKAMLDNYGELI